MYNYEIKRGDIYYIAAAGETVGSEMHDGRPAIVVSNEDCNKYSPVVEIVYLTTREKKELPTHVTINSAKYRSTAICEQITTIGKERIGDFVGMCSDEEMEAIDKALLISLEIDNERAPCQHLHLSESDRKLIAELQEELIPLREFKEKSESMLNKVTAERDVYKELYMDAISKITKLGV